MFRVEIEQRSLLTWSYSMVLSMNRSPSGHWARTRVSTIDRLRHIHVDSQM